MLRFSRAYSGPSSPRVAMIMRSCRRTRPVSTSSVARSSRSPLSSSPNAAAADEMLLEGEGRIRALLSCGGNPMLAWPDQIRTRNAFEQLDLLVQIDTSMSATAEMADYVIAAKRAFEMPGFNVLADIQ